MKTAHQQDQEQLLLLLAQRAMTKANQQAQALLLLLLAHWVDEDSQSAIQEAISAPIGPIDDKGSQSANRVSPLDS
jgi:hypothetical protein